MNTQEENKRLEESFKKQHEMMLNNVVKYLQGVHTSPESEITNIQKILFDGTMTEKFEYFGSMLYLIGMDFMNMPPYKPEFLANVYKRLGSVIKATDYNDIVYLYTTIFDEFKKYELKDFESALKEYESAVDKEIDSKYDWNKILYIIKKLFNNSSMQIKFAFDLNQILLNKVPSYRDILKINTSISEHANYIGAKAVEAFKDLYTNENWSKVLTESVKQFDKLKIGNIFMEMINIAKDNLIKFEPMGIDMKDVISILAGSPDKIETCNKSFDDFVEKEKQKREEALKKQEENDAKKDPTVSYIPNVDMSKVMNENPIKAFLYVVHESYDEYKKLETFDNIFEGMMKLTDNDEYMADVYKYLKNAYSKITGKETLDEYSYINVKEFTEYLVKKYDIEKEEYSKLVKSVCTDLSDVEKGTINNKLTKLIGYMILENSQQKQFLITQYFEGGIKTVNHLLQIMHIIEEGSILCNNDALALYTDLYNTVKNNFEPQLQDASKIDKVHTKMSFIISTKQLFEKWMSLQNVKDENKSE